MRWDVQMSGDNKTKDLKINIDIPEQVQVFASQAVAQVNFQNPALFDEVTLKESCLFLSALDCDIFLKELRTTKISQIEWQRIKQQILNEFRSICGRNLQNTTLLGCIEQCSELVYSSLPPFSSTEDQSERRASRARMTIRH